MTDPAPLVTEEEVDRALTTWFGPTFSSSGYGNKHYKDEFRAMKRLLESFLSTRPAGVIPEGWKLVPREPTEAMAKAGRIVTDITPNTGRVTTWATNRWEEILDAAPTYSPQPEGGDAPSNPSSTVQEPYQDAPGDQSSPEAGGPTVEPERSSEDASRAPDTTGGWRDIASAPRDGREMLLWLPYDRRFTRMLGEVAVGSSESDAFRPATDWMPLPAPPPATSGPNAAPPPANINDRWEINVIPDHELPNQWIVEAIDIGGEGDVHQTIFPFGNTEARARAYAKFLADTLNVAEAPIEMLVDQDWLRRKVDVDPDLESEARSGSDEDRALVPNGWIACSTGGFNIEWGQQFEVMWEGGIKGTKIIAYRLTNSGVDGKPAGATSEPGRGHAGSVANSPVAWMVTRPAGQIYGRHVFVTLDREEAESSTGNPKPIVQPLYLAPSPSVAGLVEMMAKAMRNLIEHADAMEAQNQDYHGIGDLPGPIRSQPLETACEALAAYEAQRAGRGER